MVTNYRHRAERKGQGAKGRAQGAKGMEQGARGERRDIRLRNSDFGFWIEKI